MHIYHGTNPLATLPRVIGHEVTGQVEEVGANVQSLKPGDHVVIEPISYCGSCYACRKGRPNVCAKLSVFGVHQDGGMREYIVLPERQLHSVSKDLPWEEAVMAEPYTIGAQAVWRGQVKKGDTVLIQGAGPIGICVLKMAKLAGAAVMMTDLNNERLAFFIPSPFKDPLANMFCLDIYNSIGAVFFRKCQPLVVQVSHHDSSARQLCHF